MAGAGTVHHHPGVRAGAIDDAVVGELAALVQHAGIDRLAGIDLADVAGGGVVDAGDGRAARRGGPSSGPRRPSARPWCGWRCALRRRPCRRSRRFPCRSSPRASNPARGGDPPRSKISRTAACKLLLVFPAWNYFFQTVHGNRRSASRLMGERCRSPRGHDRRFCGRVEGSAAVRGSLCGVLTTPPRTRRRFTRHSRLIPLIGKTLNFAITVAIWAVHRPNLRHWREGGEDI